MRHQDRALRSQLVGLVAGACLVALGCGGSAPPAGRPSPPIRTLTEQEVEDLLLGSSIQATRNSNTARMVERARELMKEGKQFQIVSVEDLPDDWNVVSAAGGIGGGGAWEHVRERMEKASTPTISGAAATVRAMELLEQHMGVSFNAIIRNEPSGGTIAAFESAIARGLPVVDACLADRCKPEVQIQMPMVAGVPPKPAAIVTRWGDRMIIKDTVSDYRLEDLGRAIAVASGGGASIARTPLTGKEVKQGTVHGSLTKAMLWGRTVREARAKGRDPVAALVEVAGGFKLFQGIVSKADFTGDKGHSYWDAELKGVGKYQGHTYRVWVKNENIMAWLDGHVDVMPPDYICNLDPQTGDAVADVPLGGYPVGKEVVMVGIPAVPQWRTPAGLAAFGPRHFGYDFDYVPLEELQKRRATRFTN